MGSKYHAIRTVVDNTTFASKREAARYGELKLLAQAGHINNLCLQVEFPFVLAGKTMFRYYADFTYYEDGQLVVEDSKGQRLPIYKLKKKIIEHVYDIKIRET